MVLTLNKKKNVKVAAVIDIGSNMLKMRVSQYRRGEIVDLDRLEYPIRLGHEVFNSGKVSFETLREISGVLHGYSGIMSEYGVTDFRVVATTALREARNREYVADQLRIQNDITVNILENDQEKTLIYSEAVRSMEEQPELLTGNALISYIGTGSIGMAIFDGKNMRYSQNISIGSLKLHDMLSSIESETEEFPAVIEEYLDLIIGHIALPHSDSRITNLILIGNEIEIIARLCGVELENGRYIIPAELVTNLFFKMRALTPEKIGEKFHISEDTAEILYSALVIYYRLLKLTHSDRIISPKVELWDAVMRHMLVPKSLEEYNDHVTENAISCAQVLARRYHCTQSHSDNIRRFARRIFDRLKGLHGLDQKMRLILELAVILHDCGYYVNSKEHLDSSFALINHTDIYGLTDEEVRITACIAGCDEYHTPRAGDPELSFPRPETALAVSKLTAIFLLANALDKSQKQKLDDIKVRIDKDHLIITGKTDENMVLEKWAFHLCAPFFQEVFGISPVLTIKSQML